MRISGSRLGSGVRLALAVLALQPARVAAGDPYEEYNQFCLQNFSAPTEPLIYEHCGHDLAFLEDGFWLYESMNSAAIGLETNLPAKTRIEFGETPALGRATSEPERYFFIHLHHVTGLQPETTYYYRTVAVDERGHTVTTEVRTLRTRAFPGAILVPDELSGPPFILNSANTTYVVTRDIVATTRAFSIKAANVTLDLNGHTVVYDDGPALVQNTTYDKYVSSDVSTFGVYAYGNFGAARLLNGRIVQGRNNGAGNISYGFNPIYMSLGAALSEVAGVSVEYSGGSVGGIIVRYGNFHVHHNVVKDAGTVIDNRAQGIKGAEVANSEADVHHNLVKRARHQGIRPGGAASHNEIHIDSYATNGFGVAPKTFVSGNRIFGTGYHVVAIGWASKIKVSGNLIWLQGVAPTNRDDEYGADASVNGIRLTQYNGGTAPYEDNEYTQNTIIIKARERCKTMRGVQFSSDPYVKNLVLRSNIIKTEVQDDVTGPVPCVVAQGLSERSADQLPVRYIDNVFISNSCHVRFGDSYACGGNHRFYNCRLVKFGATSAYQTLRLGWWNQVSVNNSFVDCTTEEGASLDSTYVEGSNRIEYSVGHSLHVAVRSGSGEPVTGAEIWVEDSCGKTPRLVTDAEGRAEVEILEYLMRAENGRGPVRIEREQHTVVVGDVVRRRLTAAEVSLKNLRETPLLIVIGGEASRPLPPVNLRITRGQSSASR